MAKFSESLVNAQVFPVPREFPKELKEKISGFMKMFEKPKEENLSFEEKMNKFKQDSDERMLTLKRNFESKRGTRRGSK